MKRKRKGFSLTSLGSLAILFVVATVLISFGAQILGQMHASQLDLNATGARNVPTWASNITSSGLTAMDTFGDWLPTIALVVVAAIIIGIVLMYLGRRTGAA